MKSLISIIIPVYKVEKYLDRCLKSVVNQTYTDLEIILIDDGSPDNCPKMCDEWAKKDNRIKVIHIKNQGVANARNQGLKIASGDYIGFVDSDDYIEPNMFQTLFENLNNFDADVSICGFQINDENDCPANLREVPQLMVLKKICADKKYGPLWNKLYKKEIIHNIEMPLLHCCEDQLFNYYVFKKAKKIVECNSKLYHYFQNEESIVHSSFGIGAFDAVKSKQIMLQNENNTQLEPYAICGLIASCFVVLSGCIQNNMFLDKQDELIKTILNYKNEILSSNLYSKKDKLKVKVLSISPKLYKKIILLKH